MQSPWKLLLASHMTIFAIGFVAGKSIDAEELESYRSVYEKASSHWRRRFIQAALAAGSAAVLFMGAKAIFKSQQSSVQLS